MQPMSTYRKRIVEDSLAMQRMQNEIARLQARNIELERAMPTRCFECKYARETNNVAFLYCSHYQLRKGHDGFCDVGRRRLK